MKLRSRRTTELKPECEEWQEWQDVMHMFFLRTLLTQLDPTLSDIVCSKPHVQGPLWFSCVPDMDLQYMVGVIINGNPCKYWAPSSGTYHVLSPECQGVYCR